MTPLLHRLISSPALTGPSLFFPPKPQFSKISPSESLSSSPDRQNNEQQPPAKCSTIRRRDVAGITLLALFAARPAPAAAFSIGICMVYSTRNETKGMAQRAEEEVLQVPPSSDLCISREPAGSLSHSESDKESDYSSKDLEEVQKLSSSAARDCVPLDRNSFVNFQANTGVEVCTFKLVLKNAASLLDDKDPVKLEAEVILNDVIRSFSSLNGLANKIDVQSLSNRQELVDALMVTVSSLDKFEQGIMDILDV